MIHAMLPLALGIGSAGDGSDASADLRPEPPRPDFRRDEWLSLNGWWGFAFDPDDVGEHEGWARRRTDWPRRIRVPFPWQAPLSGIAERAYQGAAWYRRTFSVPPDWAYRRIVLHFGAVDWFAQVWVNGCFAGEHEGGYTPFSLDITDLLKADSQTIVVRVVDRTSADQPTGKQTGWYTPTGGIWQTVWLEPRPATYLEHVYFTWDPDGQRVFARVRIRSPQCDHATLTFEGAPETETDPCLEAQSFSLQLPAGSSEHTVTLRVPAPKLWHPYSPWLYFVRMVLLGSNEPADTVNTYFGLRTVRTGKFASQSFPYITLNEEPIYLLGALDQAFHPEGLYTYPSEAVLRGDIERAKTFGLNFLRIHIKIDEPRFLYWADRLGLLIMADMPNFTEFGPDARRRWEATLRETVARDYNHPAIFAWCLFNESWGLGNDEYKQHVDRQYWVHAMVQQARALDPTRLVEDNSPCFYDHTVTDINSWHFYINDYARARDHIAGVVQRTEPASTFNCAPGWRQADTPLINSEYGGIGAGSGDQDIAWCFKYLTNELRRHARIGGYVYTELCDIEWEHNGFMNYDRTLKEFGYNDFVPGFSLADLNRPDFLVLDGPPLWRCTPGADVEVPVLFSHFGPVAVSEGRLRWVVSAWDGLGRYHEDISSGERQVSFVRWTVTPLGGIPVTVPAERALLVLAVRLEGPIGDLLARNYTVLLADAPLRQTEQMNAQTTVVRWKPSEWADISWPAMRAFPGEPPDKVWGEGAGYVEYAVALPSPATVWTGAELLLEIAAKAGREKVEWSDKPSDYPQTDRTKWPTMVRVLIDGLPVATVTLPDDPADARGVLSHAAGFHPGSYGYAQRIPIDRSVLERSRNNTLRVRLEVPEDAQARGGLAVFGESLGRYPFGPTLVLRGG